MKKTLMVLAAIMTFAGLTATAQKSSNYLVGSLSYSKSTNVETTYGFSPLVGRYMTDKTSAGIFGDFKKSTGETTTNVGMFVRNDFLKISKNCDVFAQLSVASNSTTITGFPKTTAFVGNVGLGTNYSLSSKWGLTMNLADIITYRSTKNASSLNVGFGTITNPFSTSSIGVAYKF